MARINTSKSYPGIEVKEGLTAAFNAAQLVVEAAKDGQSLPDLNDAGLCWLLSEEDEWSDIYDAMCWLFMDSAMFVDTRGVWTKSRINLLVLLSVMEAEDFI